MSALSRDKTINATHVAAKRVAPRISTRSALIQLAVLAIGGVLAIVLAGDSPHQTTVTLTLIYITFAAAWNIVAGFAGQFAFGHAAFFGIGAYGATLLTQWTGLPPLFGLWVGVVLAAVAATVIGLITLKLRGLYFGLVTVVFPTVFAVFMTYLGLQEVSVPFRAEGGPDFFSPGKPSVLSWFSLGAAMLVCIIAVLLLRSRFGLFCNAVRSDQDAAEASGVRTTRVKIYALVLSAGLSAIAGGLYASVALVVTPADVFGLQMSVKPVLFTIFGGIGTLAGPVLGAAILVPLSEVLTATFGSTLPSLSGLVYGAILLLVITLFPGGLVPVLAKIGTSVWHKVSRSPDCQAATQRAREAPAPSSASAGAVGPERIVAVVAPSASAANAKSGGVPILEVGQIAKAFGGTKVLKDVTMEINHGEIVGVIGPNGAGKTTLFNIINGFLRSDGGFVKLSGTDITRAEPSAIAALGLGRTFQTVRLFSGMSAIENVLVAALMRHPERSRAAEAAWMAIEEVELADRADVLVSELTTGELRRLELARSMATAGPNGLLLLDEFLGGLDKVDGTVLLASLVRWRERGGSVLAIEHTMRAMADFVDRFIVLNFGTVIAQGQPEEILQNRDVIKAYLGDKWEA